jgi:integrase
MLGTALNDAVRFDIVARNVTSRGSTPAPKVERKEAEIIAKEQISEVRAKFKSHPVYHKALVALFAGPRRGEVPQETKQGVKFKDTTKTKAGRRVVNVLRDIRREQLELRVALGLGKLPDDALVYPARDGGLSRPTNLSAVWADVAAAIGLSNITYHCLRHTHASMLIDAGIDVMRISKSSVMLIRRSPSKSTRISSRSGTTRARRRSTLQSQASISHW